MRISDWSSDVCSSDLTGTSCVGATFQRGMRFRNTSTPNSRRSASGSVVMLYRPHMRASRGSGSLRGIAAWLDTVRPLPSRRLQASRRGDHGEVRHRPRSEEHKSELQSLMRISYAVFCLNTNKQEKSANNT